MLDELVSVCTRVSLHVWPSVSFVYAFADVL
jgi:hypothetical protein